MKTKRSQLIQQQKMIEKKLAPWMDLRVFAVPPSGWLKAVRGALGLSAAQLARRMGINQASLTRLEAREGQGTVTLESLEKAARAMNCRLIYAIVPDNNYDSLDAILRERARMAALRILAPIGHTMKLEQQGVGAQETEEHARELADELRAKLDPRLWDDEAALVRRGRKT